MKSQILDNVGFRVGSQPSGDPMTKAVEEAKKKTLVEIHRAATDITNQILELSGDDVPEEMAKRLETTMQELVTKADGYGHVLDQLMANQDFCARRREEWAKGARAAASAINRLKTIMKFVLSQREDKQVQGEEFRFFLAKAADQIEIENEELIPREFFSAKMVYSIDKDKLETALKSGQVIPGAKLKTGNFSLRSGRAK